MTKQELEEEVIGKELGGVLTGVVIAAVLHWVIARSFGIGGQHCRGAPVLAVVEYTYERDGQIVVPAGAKAVRRIQETDRSAPE